MATKNRCAFLNAQHEFTIEERDIPVPKDDEVLVRVMANGICGSDVHFYAEGRLGNFVVTKPYIPEHEAAGIVEDTGKNVKGFRKGERVAIEPGIPCDRCRYCKTGRYNLCPSVVFLSAPPVNGTFCDYICIRSDFLHKIPEDMPFEHGAMIEPTAVAVHAVNRAGFINGKDCAIYGAGPIGLLTLQAFKAMGGGKAVCLDILDKRLELAKALGADEVLNASQCGHIKDIADVVFETAGSPQATAQLFSAVRAGGTVVQVGWPTGNIVAMNIADFIEKELDYVSVNRYANAYPAAIRYICDGRIRVEPLITQTYSFQEIPEAFRFAKENPKDTIKIIVKN